MTNQIQILISDHLPYPSARVRELWGNVAKVTLQVPQIPTDIFWEYCPANNNCFRKSSRLSSPFSGSAPKSSHFEPIDIATFSYEGCLVLGRNVTLLQDCLFSGRIPKPLACMHGFCYSVPWSVFISLAGSRKYPSRVHDFAIPSRLLSEVLLLHGKSSAS